MKFSAKAGKLAAQRTGCVVVGVYDGRRLSPAAMELDAASHRALSVVLDAGDLDGGWGATLLLHKVAHLACERVLLVGLGPEEEFRELRYLAALEAAAKALRTIGAAEATMCLHELPVNGRRDAWKIEQAVLAVTSGFYQAGRLKSKAAQPRHALKHVVLHLEDRSVAPAAGAAIERASAIVEGIALAKDLGNLPGNICTPTYLAQEALELGERHGFEVEVLERPDIEKLGMGGFLAVAQGSREPPKLIAMAYRGGEPESAPIVLVGKGITFDSGGISIKPAAELDEMKFDMCGAASVFGALHAAALMKLAVNVVGIVPATENMPDGHAVKPGDVVTTMSGQTVEILDTDCEGRVVLCDALTYARKFKPALVVDVATLTAEIVRALGDVATGVFSNSDALAREIVEAGEEAWDRAWQMPLWDEYQDALKSNFADLPNIGSHADCAVTAACFLSRFTQDYPWVHLDIAGTAARGGTEKGATGRPVALLVHFLAGRASRA